jgi:hypothetical protein
VTLPGHERDHGILDASKFPTVRMMFDAPPTGGDEEKRFSRCESSPSFDERPTLILPVQVDE